MLRSLVGSEMCIRDRVYVMPGPAALLLRRAGLASWKCSIKHWRPGWTPPPVPLPFLTTSRSEHCLLFLLPTYDCDRSSFCLLSGLCCRHFLQNRTVNTSYRRAQCYARRKSLNHDCKSNAHLFECPCCFGSVSLAGHLSMHVFQCTCYTCRQSTQLNWSTGATPRF